MSETESATAAEGTSSPAETMSEATPSIEWIRDFTPRWLDACNSHEVDGLLALMSEDIECRSDAWPKPMRGHADVREFLEAMWRAMPDMTFELLGGPYVIPGEPRAAIHWRGWATHTGPLEPPGFAPTGRRWELDGADFHEYRDDRVCKLRIAFNMLSVSRQLGLMPAAGGRAERALAMAQRSASRVASRVQQAVGERRGGLFAGRARKVRDVDL
jgi:steroid delta-isomerase-like uncharacterized protein